MSELKVGDHVWLDDPGPKKVHWIIIHIGQGLAGPGLKTRKTVELGKTFTYANLRSGLTGIHKRGVAIERLTLHTKGQVDGIRQEEKG